MFLYSRYKAAIECFHAVLVWIEFGTEFSLG